MKNALEDIAYDLKDGGINPGLYDYLHKYMDKLKIEEYKSNYHNILEYLVRLMKEKIKLNIKN
ncbi:MAG: hypothetical protein N3A61_04010, partial [Ignavibacteria bacterium]|nr:hypothetical protein [Ignavibacteria bacterium]